MIGAAIELSAEAGELVNEVKKHVRQHGLNVAVNHSLRAKIADEMGDVLWALAALANELDLSLRVCMGDNMIKLRARAATDTLINTDKR